MLRIRAGGGGREDGFRDIRSEARRPPPVKGHRTSRGVQAPPRGRAELREGVRCDGDEGGAGSWGAGGNREWAVGGPHEHVDSQSDRNAPAVLVGRLRRHPGTSGEAGLDSTPCFAGKASTTLFRPAAWWP